MSKIKYSYNPKTLRYEPARFPWGAWIQRLLGMMMLSVTLFYCFVLIQNRFFETERERILRAENDALKRHQGAVESNLYQAQIQLAALSSKDAAIYKSIFLTDKPVSDTDQRTTKELMSIELSDFENKIEGLMEKANAAHQKAVLNSSRFARLFWPKKQDVAEMLSYPTHIPVKGFTADQLACGFGEHINPFHKLLYRHKGIDIAAEKGTDIVASGSGRVIMISNQSTPFGLGNYIEIEHEKGYRSRYAHLNEIKVSVGQRVKQGQLIGTVGMSGSAVAPHLHYEVSKNGNTIDPVYLFAEQLNEKEWLGLIDNNKQVKQALD